MAENNNLILLFVYWWYGEATTKFFAYLKKFYIYLTDMFSVGICLRTLFAPWKRDQLSTEGLSLQDQFHIWVLNLASRIIGCLVKTATIVTFLVALCIATVFVLGGITFWFAWPIISLWLIMKGIGSILL